MRKPLHPLNIVLLAGMIPLFLGVLFADIAYFDTHEVQWKNFSSWLLVGGLVHCGFAMLWALIDVVRIGWRARMQTTYFLLLLATWVLGFINALVHAADAWASMPGALVLSVITAVLVLAASWLGLSRSRTREAS
jgi:uncharacterized membrane protein